MTTTHDDQERRDAPPMAKTIFRDPDLAGVGADHQRFFNSRDELVEILVPVLFADLERIPARERLQILRQIFFGRHLGAADEEGNTACRS